ncbi:GNAT family N-acetyltransferase [Streptomyces thermoviolaceus]|uniref:GNAT family N-acetyltransferase n=1 Tax=Streptomyces thermoviolaceus TaxID=1952 RepID=UPI00203BF5D5|nr:GNAT family N-acetyltransferase [Streptomyces thermoviolaceus]MCM3264166.1 GNAT family N-acetyltransferase [Streptomyces thermoviolaceus]
MSAWSTRAACPADLPELQALLTTSCHAAVQPSLELLTEAIERRLVQVAERSGVLVGCAAAEMPSSGHVRLSVVAVRDGMRQQGIGTQLLNELVQSVVPESNDPPLMSALANTEQLPVIRLLLSCGFIGTRVMRTDETGEPLLVYFQHKVRVEYIDPDARHLVPTGARAQLVESLSPSDHAITALVPLSGAPAFEIARFERDDPATLQSGEAAAGIAFSGSILSAVTFLLGFSFASERFPDDVRLLLTGATFSTVLSLIVYASASGELARIRSNSFGKIMKWGNVLSEYGGVLPFVISLPVTYAQVSGNPWTTMVLAATLSFAIAWYERSEFSIAFRFRRSRGESVLLVLTALSPLVGAALVATHTTSWPWTAALAVTLTTRTWLYLFRREAEQGLTERRRWQIRG